MGEQVDLVLGRRPEARLGLPDPDVDDARPGHDVGSQVLGAADVEDGRRELVASACIRAHPSRRSGGVRKFRRSPTRGADPGGTTMRTRVIAGGAAGLALALTGALPASADDHDAMLSVLHGVPDLTVDVYVNGERTLDDFTPGTLAGPLELAPGTYSVAITAADAADASAPAVGPVDLTLAGNGNYTAVAHLDAAGAPTATLFTNDISDHRRGPGPADRAPHRRSPRRRHPGGRFAGDHQPVQPGRAGPQPPRGHRLRVGRRDRHHHPGDRAGRRPRLRGRQHDRLRVGQPGGRQPPARRPAHRGPALRARRRPVRRARPRGGRVVQPPRCGSARRSCSRPVAPSRRAVAPPCASRATEPARGAAPHPRPGRRTPLPQPSAPPGPAPATTRPPRALPRHGA